MRNVTCPIHFASMFMIAGVRCGSPALRGHTHCYYHHSLRRLLPKRFHNWESYNNETDRGIRMIPMPLLEDATSLQTAYMQIIHGVLSGQMYLPCSRVAPAALQAAARNLPMVKLERKAVEELQAEGGEALANDVAQSVESQISSGERRQPPEPPEEQKGAYQPLPVGGNAEGGIGQADSGAEPGDIVPADPDPVPLYIRKRAAEARAGKRGGRKRPASP